MITIVDNQQAYADALRQSFVLVDFFTETCMPCRMFGKILEQLSEERPELAIVKVNLTRCPELAIENGIQAVPAVRIVKDGQNVDEWLGLTQLDELLEKIDMYT